MKKALSLFGLGTALPGVLALSAVALAAPARAVPAAPTTPACSTDQLTVAPDPGDGDIGIGNLALMYRLHNRSAHSCTLYGYPGIQLLDAHRRPLPTRLTWSRGAYLFYSPPARLVRLTPGGDAFFALGWNHAAGAPANHLCPNAPYMLVTPPNERTSLLLRDGPDSCDGRLTASPVQATRFRI